MIMLVIALVSLDPPYNNIVIENRTDCRKSPLLVIDYRWVMKDGKAVREFNVDWGFYE